MEMNKKRLHELQTFKDDFNIKLQNASERYEENNEEINTSKLLLTINDNNDTTTQNFYPKKKLKLNKLSISSDIFHQIPPWKPNKLSGDYFSKFIRNDQGRDLSPWEIVNNKFFLKKFYFFFYRIDCLY